MRIGFKDFFVKLDSLSLPIFFFTGPEDYLKLRAKERIVQKPAFNGFSKTRLDGPSLDLQSLWDSLSSPGLFSSGEIIIVERANRIGAANKRSLLEMLENWEENATPSRVLILISQAERQDPADPLEGHLLASPKAYHVFFPMLSEAEVISWAKGELKRRQILIQPQVLESISHVFSNDLYNWTNLIRNAELYLAGKGELGASDLKKLLSQQSAQEDKLIEQLRGQVVGFLAQKAQREQFFGTIIETIEHVFAQSPDPETACALKTIRIFADLVYELGVAKNGLYSSFRKRFPEIYYQLKKAAPKWSWPEIEALYAVLIGAEKNIKTGKLDAYSTIQKFTADFLELKISQSA